MASLFSSINSKEVLQNLPDAVFVMEPDGRILWVNEKAAAIFETGRSTLKGSYFDEIVPDGRELAAQAAAQKKSVVTGAFRYDGREIYIEISARQYIEQYFITLRDVTPLTGMLAQVEHTEKMNKEKNTMLVKLSNELKSPLQSITGFSQVLLEGTGGALTEKQEKYLRIINKNSSELLYFMEKLLAFSEAESSLLEPEYGSFDIAKTIQQVMKDNDSMMFAKKLLFDFDSEGLKNKTVCSDESLIKIIVQNILETSIKATDTGVITVKLANPDSQVIERSGIYMPPSFDSSKYVLISINDTGVGYAEHELEGLFEPYVQLEKSNKKGLLRSIKLGTVYTLVRKLHGTVWVESGIMKGATFNVLLLIEGNSPLPNVGAEVNPAGRGEGAQ
ncbi:MAG: PAS domain-containing sensor histidine kinase [Heliobacteriaceae bacterium]|nr:PAS domain-containing sensor histidine kinase [Heliobacteriaceae bacterium]